MPQNFSDWKDNVKESSNIVTVISKYIQLQRRGKTWWANCPFHFEKTPSFAVNELDQYYHCFGCGASGDVIKFVEKIESCDFMQAVEILAKDANIEIPVFAGNENIAKQKKEREVLYEILREAALHYHNNLKLPTSKTGIEYLQKRNINQNTVKNFALGYSVGWNEVVNHLIKKGYTPEQIKLAGVADERDGRYMDAYAKRLIFPIINNNSDVVGFSARMLEDANFAKYKNTAQTPVFDKSKVLYGVNNLKKLKQEQHINEIIIVEGQMDLIALYQKGIKNVVATMGTALTSLHGKDLKRYSDKIVLCFDGDSAGKKAALRSIDILNSVGFEVYLMKLPVGIDPDDYVNKNGKDAFLKLVNESNYWVEYLIRDFESNYDLSKLNEKSDFIINALNVVKKLDSLSEQNVYLELIKNITNISVDILKDDLKNLDNVKTESSKNIELENDLSSMSQENAYVKAVKFVLASLLHKKDYATLETGLEENFLNPDYKSIYNYISKTINNGKKPIISVLFDMFEVESSEDIKSLISFEFNDNMNNQQYYKDCVKLINQTGLFSKQKELTEKMSSTKDMDERREIVKQLNEIMTKIRNIDKK